MTRFAGLPFVVIDDGTLPADTVPRLLPFATSVAVIAPTSDGDLAGRFIEAGIPATVHVRGGALLRHAAAHSAEAARRRVRHGRGSGEAEPAAPADAAAPADSGGAADAADPSDPAGAGAALDTGDRRGLGHAVELAASDAMTIVVTGPPDDAEDWMRCALTGVSGIMEHGRVIVPMLVLADGELPEGPVVSLSGGDASSGYEEILAAGLAQRLERPVELIASAGDDAAAASVAHSQAEQLAHDAGVAWVRRSLDDPLAEVRSRRERIGAVVTSVIDVAEGYALEPGGMLPPEAVASGSARTAIEVLRDAPHDVIVVFDGVRLLLGADEGRFVATGVGEALAAEAAEAAEAAGPEDATHADPAPAGETALVPVIDVVGVGVPSPMADSIADPAHVLFDEPTFLVPPAVDAAPGPEPSGETGSGIPDILSGVARSLATIGAALTAAGTGRHRSDAAASPRSDAVASRRSGAAASAD